MESSSAQSAILQAFHELSILQASDEVKSERIQKLTTENEELRAAVACADENLVKEKLSILLALRQGKKSYDDMKARRIATEETLKQKTAQHMAEKLAVGINQKTLEGKLKAAEEKAAAAEEKVAQLTRMLTHSEQVVVKLTAKEKQFKMQCANFHKRMDAMKGYMQNLGDNVLEMKRGKDVIGNMNERLISENASFRKENDELAVEVGRVLARLRAAEDQLAQSESDCREMKLAEEKMKEMAEMTVRLQKYESRDMLVRMCDSAFDTAKQDWLKVLEAKDEVIAKLGSALKESRRVAMTELKALVEEGHLMGGKTLEQRLKEEWKLMAESGDFCPTPTNSQLFKALGDLHDWNFDEVEDAGSKISAENSQRPEE